MAEARGFAKLPVIVHDDCHHPTIANNSCQSDKIQEDLGLSMPVENVVHQANWGGKIHLNFVRAPNGLSGDGELASVCASIALFWWWWVWCDQVFQLLLPQLPPMSKDLMDLWIVPKNYKLKQSLSPLNCLHLNILSQQWENKLRPQLLMLHSPPEPRATWLRMVSDNNWKNPSQGLPHNSLSFCFYLKVTLSDLSGTQDKHKEAFQRLHFC